MKKNHKDQDTDRQTESERKARKQRLAHNLESIGHKLLVMSGKGGVGKSTVAAHLALGLARAGYRVGLLDIDLHGPSIARILGLKDHAGSAEGGDLIEPLEYSDNLEVVSIEVLMKDRDASVIWRGPMKIKAIKQFLADVCWGDLDFLVIDSPPGTGDEPLTIAQTIPGAQAVIVTTPQELALADVRKSIDFCRRVEMPILGIVENLSGMICPHCGGTLDPFGQGGGQSMASRYGLAFLGRLPWDLRIVKTEDLGEPLDLTSEDTGAGPGFRTFLKRVIEATEKSKPELGVSSG